MTNFQDTRYKKISILNNQTFLMLMKTIIHINN